MKHLIISLLSMLFLGCEGQEKKRIDTDKDKEKKASTQIPNEKWDVRKTYDEAGNLVIYDSIYSYSYANPTGDSLKVNLDSVMQSFRSFYEKTKLFTNGDHLSYVPKYDSLFMKNFFQDDYFLNQWQRQPIQIEEMLKKMDSTRNEFLKKFYPGLIKKD